MSEMETQHIHSNKTNKITVPFYSPPSRLYGQTPAEIIKEARASVMNSPSVGIKPVFTNRPFTPKEKERTLFGNVKKKTSRPPSSFSLSYLQKQEAVPRVKLPSIGIAPKKKQNRANPFRSVVSLDNLTEEYEGEIIEEMRDIDYENLPAFRKSYSCPQERAMTRAASYTDKLYNPSSDTSNAWMESRNHYENLPDSHETYSQQKNNSENFYDYSKINSSAEEKDTSKWTDNGFAERMQAYQNRVRNETARLGGGDYERPKTFEETLLVKKTHRLSELLQPKDGQKPDSFKPENRKSVSKKKKRIQESIIPKEQNTEAIITDKAETSEEKIEEIRESKLTDEEMPLQEPKPSEVVKEMTNEEETADVKIEEKSVETELKSDYLSMIQKNESNANEEIRPKPREILELYETARYYGVVLDESKNIVSSSSSSVSGTNSAVEDIFGQKESNSKPSNNYLQDLKINFKQIDEKMKKLNGSIEKFEKKLNTTKNHAVKAINDNAINEAKVTGDNKKESKDKEFVMNNNKRYHVSNKNSAGEKAYKKWANNKESVNNSVDKENSRDGGWDFFWKNTYFRSKDADENKQTTQDDAALEYIKGVVDRLNGFVTIGCEDQEVIDTTTQLYKSMKSGGYFSNNTLENKFKTKLLRNLYQFADSENPEILLSLARIIFALRVESSLPAGCKMVFKVARSDANDHFFIDMEDILELFLEGIGRASPLDAAESCIYGYGALKFLTMNHGILSRALHLGALDLMTLHMKMINTTSMEEGSVGEQTQHALFQLTGALRHIAAGDGALPLFITTNSIPILCKTLLLFRRDEDIVTNISRTLSLLSTDEDVTQILMSVDNILNIIIDLIEQYKNNDKILIRLSYCLGNIVAHSDLARIQLSRNENCLTTLLGVLKLYIDKDLELTMKEKKDESDEDLDPETVDDIIVKVIRIIANMSMNPVVGSNLSPATNEKNSLQLSQLLSVLLLRKDPGITLLATLGCLNNISYYCNSHSTLVDITQGVVRVLGLPSEDCQAEAARVLGNLTRHKEIRNLLFNTGGIEQLSKLLTCKDREVVRCACGALVNMMLDPETRKFFVESQGIDKLIEALELFAGDWSLAGLVCRAIWNSCAEDVSSAMQHNDMEHLLNTLANSLEEENWNDGDMVWEEFATIATDLLERINSHLESA